MEEHRYVRGLKHSLLARPDVTHYLCLEEGEDYMRLSEALITHFTKGGTTAFDTFLGGNTNHSISDVLRLLRTHLVVTIDRVIVILAPRNNKAAHGLVLWVLQHAIITGKEDDDVDYANAYMVIATRLTPEAIEHIPSVTRSENASPPLSCEVMEGRYFYDASALATAAATAAALEEEKKKKKTNEHDDNEDEEGGGPMSSGRKGLPYSTYMLYRQLLVKARLTYVGVHLVDMNNLGINGDVDDEETDHMDLAF